MNTRKHIVRSIVLGLVGTALAFAHPTDPGVGSPTQLSELRQEKHAFVQYRVAWAAAARAAAQALAQACEQEARHEAASASALETFDERGDISGLEAILEAAERDGLPLGGVTQVDATQVDVLAPSSCL